MKLIHQATPFILFLCGCFSIPINSDLQIVSENFLTVQKKEFYFATVLKANFFGAAHYCKHHNMELASLETKEENDAVLRHIEESGFNRETFWLSGNDLSQEGKFFWLATGNQLGYTNWHVHEPNNGIIFGPENCVGLWYQNGKGYHWNDGACHNKFYFICQKLKHN